LESDEETDEYEMDFSGEIVSLLWIPPEAFAPFPASFRWGGLVCWVVFIIAVEDDGRFKDDGADNSVEMVMTGVWP
jgi:hypothetical protein